MAAEKKKIGISSFRRKLSSGEILREDVVISVEKNGIAEVTGELWTCKFYAGTKERARLWIDL